MGTACYVWISLYTPNSDQTTCHGLPKCGFRGLFDGMHCESQTKSDSVYHHTWKYTPGHTTNNIIEKQYISNVFHFKFASKWPTVSKDKIILKSWVINRKIRIMPIYAFTSAMLTLYAANTRQCAYVQCGWHAAVLVFSANTQQHSCSALLTLSDGYDGANS